MTKLYFSVDAQLRYLIAKRLKQKGFTQSHKDEVICRWRIENIILDVMPTDERILGFTNVWYKPAVSQARYIPLQDDLTIRIVTALYFLATKLEAFIGRGNNDYFASHDLEDIITLFDGRPGIVQDIQQSDVILKNYLVEKLKIVIQTSAFQDALPGHLNYGVILNERLKIVWDRIESVCRL